MVSREIETFIEYLDGARDHVLGILDGLPADDLRRAVLPSGWNCLELVRHLTVDVERFWFRGVVAGEPAVTGTFVAGLTAHWHVPDGMSAEEVLADYRAEVEYANAVLAALPDGLDREPAVWPVALWPGWRLPDLRSVLLHVVTETSVHAGHLDAVRELIDGASWFGRDPYDKA